MEAKSRKKKPKLHFQHCVAVISFDFSNHRHRHRHHQHQHIAAASTCIPCPMYVLYSSNEKINSTSPTRENIVMKTRKKEENKKQYKTNENAN